MPKRIASIALFVLIIFIAACEPIIIDDATPTQEVNDSWRVDCLPDDIVPMNTNPCLVPKPGGIRPYDIEWAVEPNNNHDGRLTAAEWTDNHWMFPLAGQAGEGFAGFIGLRIHNLALDDGQCYALNFVGELDLRGVPKDEMSDISALAFAHTDSGNKMLLGTHGVTRPEGFNFVVEENPDWFWFVWAESNTTIIIEVGINQIHANARMGNHFDLESVYFHPVDNDLCSGGMPIS